MPRIVQTDNIPTNYPTEQFVLGHLNADQAIAIANVINEQLSGAYAGKFWKVVPTDYKLAEPFTP